VRRQIVSRLAALLIGGYWSGIGPVAAAELVSLKNLGLSRDEHVWGFDIHLREGRIVSICDVPEGWKITAENYGEAGDYKDGGGELKGDADFDHDTLTVEKLPKFGYFFLIDRSEIHHERATLTGLITTNGPNGNRKIELNDSNFVHLEANRCPSARL
jgi:hypothetical protein